MQRSLLIHVESRSRSNTAELLFTNSSRIKTIDTRDLRAETENKKNLLRISRKCRSTLCANSAKYKQPVEEVLEVDNKTSQSPRHLVIRIATRLLPAAAYINDQQRFRRSSTIRRSKISYCYLQCGQMLKITNSFSVCCSSRLGRKGLRAGR